jgi:hypothetical protein
MSGRKVYEEGSVVAMGLQTCRDLDDKWFMEGVALAKEGLPNLCWNSMQEAGYAYGLMCVALESDWAMWWHGDYVDVLPAEQREDWVGD